MVTWIAMVGSRIFPLPWGLLVSVLSVQLLKSGNRVVHVVKREHVVFFCLFRVVDTSVLSSTEAYALIGFTPTPTHPGALHTRAHPCPLSRH